MLRRRLAAAALAVTRKAARAEARQARAARAEERRAVRAEARRAAGAPSGAAARGRVGWLVQAAPIVVAVAALGLAAAGWRGGGGPDTLAGEVAVVRAAGGSGGGLVVQEPRVGPIEPLQPLARGAWLRATPRPRSLEGAIREAGVPSRFLLVGVVVPSVLVLLLLMRVGPGTGAAAGPGPTPPHRNEPELPGRRWRLGAAALAGALVASTRCWSAAGGDRDGPGCRARPGGARAGLGGARTAGPALADLPWRHRSGARSDPPSPTTAWPGWQGGPQTPALAAGPAR
jgi:hypothetical protein